MPSSLARFFGAGKLSFREVKPSEFVHCIIDVQRAYCDPLHPSERGNKETKKVAERIAKIAPVFREAGIPTFIVYFDGMKNKGHEKARGGLFKITAEPGDILISKNKNSAFEGSDMLSHLKKHRAKTLLVSGFNTSACVYETVCDGLKQNFTICVMEDCIGNDNNNSEAWFYIWKMKLKGAMFLSHREVFQDLNLKRRPSPSAP